MYAMGAMNTTQIRPQPEDKFRANKFLPNLGSKCPPIGISEYELSKLYPTEVEGMIPTIEEIEAKLGELPQEDGKDE